MAPAFAPVDRRGAGRRQPGCGGGERNMAGIRTLTWLGKERVTKEVFRPLEVESTNVFRIVLGPEQG